jgi:hypothetical protein
MRKLVVAIITLLAIFTFIREYRPAQNSPSAQKAQIESPLAN